MTVEDMVKRLRDHGYLCWHMGESTKGVWTVRFVDYYERDKRLGKRGPVLDPWSNGEVYRCADGDTLHEAVKSVMEDVCPLSHEPEFDMDVMLGLKPENRSETPLDLAAMLR
jgi:hypothetical protein